LAPPGSGYLPPGDDEEPAVGRFGGPLELGRSPESDARSGGILPPAREQRCSVILPPAELDWDADDDTPASGASPLDACEPEPEEVVRLPDAAEELTLSTIPAPHEPWSDPPRSVAPWAALDAAAKSASPRTKVAPRPRRAPIDARTRRLDAFISVVLLALAFAAALAHTLLLEP
jgi:hypothetical protein